MSNFEVGTLYPTIEIAENGRMSADWCDGEFLNCTDKICKLAELREPLRGRFLATFEALSGEVWSNPARNVYSVLCEARAGTRC